MNTCLQSSYFVIIFQDISNIKKQLHEKNARLEAYNEMEMSIQNKADYIEKLQSELELREVCFP